MEACRNINYPGGTLACAAQCTKEHADELARHFSAPASDEATLEWLFSEYKPTLLKNGDGLKPGDWIEVSDEPGEEWLKRAFMCYSGGFFYAVDDGYGLSKNNVYNQWKQARLPEDGE